MIEQQKKRRQEVRCALNTRKSSEEGHEQSFNSLHAQREACEAYVLSQRHEGWTVVPTAFDDGGFSRGSMDRPALQRLLNEIRAGRIDVVVVYKIDRLTRSLFDFAKIVEILDAAGASFVSVIQSFNTTTSMGRLTLNVLLSFAQFEREVTGERIRDKIAASKRKGMWMGGNIPFGYDLKERALVANEAEVTVVRLIFAAYDRLGTVAAMKAEIDLLGVCTRTRTIKRPDGGLVTSGGKAFGAGHLHAILRNPLYAGRIRHKDKVHDGGHAALIDEALWQWVQERLTAQWVDRMTSPGKGVAPALLTGRICTLDGRRLIPTHSVKGSRRYRYYATGPNEPETVRKKEHGGAATRIAAGRGPSRAFKSDEHPDQGGAHLRLPPVRYPAVDIEAAVLASVTDWLSAAPTLIDWNGAIRSKCSTGDIVERAGALAKRLERERNSREGSLMLRSLIARVEMGEDRLRITLSAERLFNVLALDPGDEPKLFDPMIERAFSARRRGRDRKLVLAGATGTGDPDQTQIAALARARSWFASLRDHKVASIADLARKSDANRGWISSQLSLAFLAPDIMEAVITGENSPALNLDRLLAIASSSPDWVLQRRAFKAL